MVIIKAITIINDMYIPYLYMPKNKLRTLTTFLMDYANAQQGSWQSLAAGIVIIMLPTILIYVFFQRYILAGRRCRRRQGISCDPFFSFLLSAPKPGPLRPGSWRLETIQNREVIPMDTAQQSAAVEAVVTSYNQGPLILEALDSLYRQTVRPARILLVDDGSTDPASLAILAGIEAGPAPVPVQVIRRPNGGVSAPGTPASAPPGPAWYWFWTGTTGCAPPSSKKPARCCRPPCHGGGLLLDANLRGAGRRGPPQRRRPDRLSFPQQLSRHPSAAAQRLGTVRRL